MAVQFVPKVEYLNSEELPLDKYPRIQVEKGVSPRMPQFVPYETIRDVTQEPPVGTTYGSTVRYLYVEFAEFLRQWKRVQVKGVRNPQWQFQGGGVNLVLASKVFAWDYVDPAANTDPKASNLIALFALVMEHELHHVADNIKILKEAMPGVALSDAVAKNYLVEARPIDDGFFQRMFAGYGKARQITDDVWKSTYTPPSGCAFEGSLNNQFQETANQKGAEYHKQVMKRYTERRNELNVAHTAGHRWKGGPGKDPWKDY